MRSYRIYEVEKDGETIFRGTVREVAYKFSLSRKAIYQAIRMKYKISGYWIIPTLDYTLHEDPVAHKAIIEQQEEKKKKKEKMQKQRKTADDIKYLADHLINMHYDNCYCVFDPEPHFNILRKMGVECTADEREDYPDETMNPKHRKKKRETHWIVEVKERHGLQSI